MKFFIVDAFTEDLFGGNPAGVVLIPDGEDFPSEEIMQKIAAELRYSETAFVKRLSERAFQTRYFTPVAEVGLCGHATIASFFALNKSGMIGEGDPGNIAPMNKAIAGKLDIVALTNRTLAGDLNIEVDDGMVWMDMASPKYIGKIEEPAAMQELYAVLGVAPPENTSVMLAPEIISTGLPDIIVPVANEVALAKMAPNYPALSALSQKYEVTGVHTFAIPAELITDTKNPPQSATGIEVRVRNFAPLYGIDEEAATGTANGALTYYLSRHGLISNSGEVNTFVQGESMGRPSRILTRFTNVGHDTRIQVGGRAVILAVGEINKY